jgi:peptidyl-prolyl cis-trans isomerase D
MKMALTASLLLAAVAGCTNEAPPAPSTGDEPARIRVQHVLIAFSGAQRAEPTVTRSQDEAEVLAKEVLARARRGEDFAKLVKDFTADHGDGNYTLVNRGQPAGPSEVTRDGFVTRFSRVAFALGVGEVGLAPYHPRESPYGYHVIKRIE